MSTRKRRDLPAFPRYVVVSALVVHAALTFVAYRDLRRRPDEQIRGSRRAWRIAIFLSPGHLAYLLFGRERQT